MRGDFRRRPVQDAGTEESVGTVLLHLLLGRQPGQLPLHDHHADHQVQSGALTGHCSAQRFL